MIAQWLSMCANRVLLPEISSNRYSCQRDVSIHCGRVHFKQFCTVGGGLVTLGVNAQGGLYRLFMHNPQRNEQSHCQYQTQPLLDAMHHVGRNSSNPGLEERLVDSDELTDVHD